MAGSLAVDLLHHRREHPRIGARQHAVAEIEDVTGKVTSRREYPIHPLAHRVRASEEHRRIEVSCNAKLAPIASPRHPTGPEIHAHHLDARLRHRRQQLRRPHAEVDARHHRHIRQCGARVREYEFAVVAFAERPGPESNSCTAEAPAATCRARKVPAMWASLSASACQAAGSASIIDLVRA